MLESTLSRFAAIVAVAVGAHLTTVLIRGASRRLLLNRIHSETKVLTVTGFTTSVIVFGIYFGAAGFLLSELGISLTTYLASATVIGLAVSFGSQGIVQDVITGLTVVFSDLLDVGDMVDIGGQVGIVQSVGMRFTVLVSFTGASVYVPNRSINSVVNYPHGFVRAYLDARLPKDAATREEAERRLAALARAVHEQYPGVVLLPPSIEGRSRTAADYDYLRIKFRIWPGQGPLLESAVKPAAIQALKSLDGDYADWMVSVHYRAESAHADPTRRLPRPAALRARDGARVAARSAVGGASDASGRARPSEPDRG